MGNERVPNREQQTVIDELERNIVLFASAGTGKTFTVAKRVSRIIETGRAAPERILCLTFTIKAANEMQEDILSYVGEAGKDVDTRTIHSFAYQVLKEESARSPEVYCVPGVCDDVDEAEELKQLLLSSGIPDGSPIVRNAKALTNFVSILKHQRELLQAYSDDEARDFDAVYAHIRNNAAPLFNKMTLFYDPACKREINDKRFLQLMESSVGSYVHRYNEQLRQSNLLDFDDLICLTHRLFRDPDTRAYWRKRFDYIFIDEMQDTSRLEYDTLRQLFPGNHIMMSGDFFQTIYEWRGSSPAEVISSFIDEFSAKTYMFAENYRSTQLLTQASFGYLQNTYPELVGQYCPDHIVTHSTDSGRKILNVRVPSVAAEAKWIYDHLLANRPDDPTKVCIMARANSYIAQLYGLLSRISCERLDGQALRFFTVDNDSKFFRKAVIKDILAFFSVLINSTDSISLNRLARKYISGVGQQTINKIAQAGQYGLNVSSFMEPSAHDTGDPYGPLLDAARSGNIVIYDTETTGLDLSHDQIIQISAIRLGSDGSVVDTLDQMVIPTIRISRGAQATHHQTMEDIIARGGVDIRTALKKFAAFCDGAVLVGHNSLRFDAPLVRRQLRECDLPPLRTVAEYDTMIIAKQLYPQLTNFKLSTLCEKFGIVNQAAHDALGDITATGEVLWCMLNRSLLPNTADRRAFVARHIGAFRKFYAFIRDLRTAYLEEGRVYEMTVRIIESCRLMKYYEGEGNQRAVEDLLYAIRSSAMPDPVQYLRGLLDDAALSGSQMDLLIRKLHKIPIITVHQSKGCEFDTVIIAGADDGNFPGWNAQVHNTVEEEKRVFYVAITRAKKQLILTSITKRTNRGGEWPVKPSRFIDRIPKHCMDTERID